MEVFSNHADVTAPPLSFSVVRKENMYDPENQKLLFPVTR